MSRPADKDYWGNFYSEVQLNYPNSRVELLTSILCSEIEEAFLLPEGKKTILEVGCGGALFSGIMASKGYQVSCCDFSPEAVAVANKNLEGIKPRPKVFVGDVTSLPVPPSSYDLIYCGGLLDIFDDPVPALVEIKKALRPGGILIATLPSRNFSIQTLADYYNSAAHRIKALFGAASPNWQRYKDNISHAPTHPPSFYAASADKAGLETLSITSGYPVPELSMPRRAKRVYVSLIRTFSGFLKGKIFKNNLFFRVFGIYYFIAARKP